MKRIAINESPPEIYHTNLDCPQLPAEHRAVTEDDERRGIRECSLCLNKRLDHVTL